MNTIVATPILDKFEFELAVSKLIKVIQLLMSNVREHQTQKEDMNTPKSNALNWRAIQQYVAR